MGQKGTLSQVSCELELWDLIFDIKTIISIGSICVKCTLLLSGVKVSFKYPRLILQRTVQFYCAIAFLHGFFKILFIKYETIKDTMKTSSHQPPLDEVWVKLYNGFQDCVPWKTSNDWRDSGHDKVHKLLVHILR